MCRQCSGVPFWLQRHPTTPTCLFQRSLFSVGIEQTARTLHHEMTLQFPSCFHSSFPASLFCGLSTSALASNPHLLPIQTVWFLGGRCLVLLGCRSVNVLMDGAYQGKSLGEWQVAPVWQLGSPRASLAPTPPSEEPPAPLPPLPLRVVSVGPTPH